MFIELAQKLAHRTDISLFEKIYLYFTHLSPPEYILLGSLLAIILFLASGKTIAFKTTSRHTKNRALQIRSMLEDAQSQNQSFEIQLNSRDSNKLLVSCILQKITPNMLVFETLGHVSGLVVNIPVDIYFSLRDENSNICYRCHSLITGVEPILSRALVKVRMPTDMDLGQKRNFYRMKPAYESIRVLALWNHPYDRPLPRSTAEIGSPMFSFANKNQQAVMDKNTSQTDEQPVMPVEDISGSGIGLRIPKPEDPESLKVGMQFLCLLVYSENASQEKLTTFWCLGKVVNLRSPSKNDGTLILGMQFSNWAVLEHGKSEIRWFHNSAANGVGPITQWVMKANMEKNKRL